MSSTRGWRRKGPNAACPLGSGFHLIIRVSREAIGVVGRNIRLKSSVSGVMRPLTKPRVRAKRATIVQQQFALRQAAA
jgi:hypothetical protein